MSRFLPRATTQRQVYNQLRARLYKEHKLRKEIEALRQELKTRSSVVTELMALGLTTKHANNLDGRLKYLNIQEERAKREAEPTVEPEKIQAIAAEAEPPK